MARSKNRLPKGLGLHDDEAVRVLASPSKGATFYKYLYTLGLYGFWRKRNTTVVTNRRLLMGRGILNREERSIPLKQVNRAKFVRRGFNSYTELDVQEGGRSHVERIGPYSTRVARRMQQEITNQS